MFKNLLKKNMIVIFGVALLCSVIVAYSFIRSSSNVSSFEQSGYVHVDANESEDKKVLFSSGQKFQNAINSQVKFKDSTNKERKLSKDNFIHYDDDSIAAFCEGVIVDINELEADASTMNHFHISPGMALRNTGSSYTAENSGMEIDFADFLWKISDNKYLAISSSINANFSETDQRDCGKYAEITYLDGKVIQIQTEDNIWQTISDKCTLTLNNGNVLDLSMKNIQDPNGNVLLDFSRIILGSEDNIELTPMSDEMEAVNENVIPRFTVNNTPGDSGADGQSGIIGLTGVDGNAGNKGQQGEDGLSDVAGGSKPDQFPLFTVADWVVGPNKCSGTILITDQSDVMINETSTLYSQLYLVDLETGQKILLNDPPGPGQFAFKENKDTTSGVPFEFSGLKTDHSYMLYAASPIQLKNPATDAYLRTFVSKTFWTDSVGVHMESAYVESDKFQVAVYNNNIHSGVNVYIINAPFKDYNAASSITLSDFVTGGQYAGRLVRLWPDATASETITPDTTYWQYSGLDADGKVIAGIDIEGHSFESNTFYYTVLAFDTNHDGTIDDYSTQILATKTLKKRPSIGAPSISANRAIWGYDVAPGLLVDNDNAVIKYTCEFYELNTDNFVDTTVEPGALQLTPQAVPVKVVDIPNNEPSAISLGGASAETYVMREVLTVYDNEKEYFIYSQFSNKVKLQASVQPYVYFEQRGVAESGESTLGNKFSISPYYDSIVGVLHITPGEDGYKYIINENSYVEISGDSYYYSFAVKDYTGLSGDALINDGTWFPASSDGGNGAVSIQFLDYGDATKSWVSGLQGSGSYHIAVFGDLANSESSTPERIGVEVGHCDVSTPPTVPLTTSLHMTPSDPSLMKAMRVAISTPTQLTKMGSPLTSEDGTYSTTELNGFYNRQLEMLYGFKISGYLGNYEDEYIYEATTDTEPVSGKQYYIKGSNNTYPDVTDVEGKNPSNEGWYEKKYNALPANVWTTKTFTKDELWKEGSNQVYMYYDTSATSVVPDEFVYGVQVVGITEADGATRFVRSTGGVIPENDADKVWIYKSYEANPATGQLDPILVTYNIDTETGLPDTEHPVDNRVTRVDINQNGSGKKLRELYTINQLIDSTIEKTVVDNVTDYVITSGGLVFQDNLNDDGTGNAFTVPGFENFTKAVTGTGGALANQQFGATFVIEALYDYTGNGNDSAINKQQHVRTLTNDLTVAAGKSYYRKDGERYASINTEFISPRVMKWYILNVLYNPADPTSQEYTLTNDEAVNGAVVYYYKNGNNYQEITFPLNPKALGWYEDALQYTNYFEFNGEKRIYIPFTRTIGDINLKEPFKGSTSSDKKIEYKERTDGYHYYYTAQANFDNSNRLADTITYKVYDAVDFYNTNAFKNDSPDYLDWALLGEDPRVTKPNETFTDSFVIQDVQTVNNSIPEGTEYVFQLVNGAGFTAKPYEWGWYEEQSGKKVITKDAGITTGKTYYINNGASFLTITPSNGSPQSLGLYEEQIKPTSDTTFNPEVSYYARILENDEITYNMVDPIDHSTPVSLCWYEDVNTVKKLTNDTEIKPGKHYYVVKTDKSFAEVNVANINNPSLLSLCYGDKTISDDTTWDFDNGTRYFVKLLIKVHSTDQNEPSMSGFSHYDTNTKISPVKLGYTEDNKVLTANESIQPGKQYYVKSKGINGDIYTPIDTNANEYKGKNPKEQGWYEANTSTKIESLDAYFDTRKTYYNGSTAVAVNPSTYGWFEDARKVTSDTKIDYNKPYYKDGTSTERLDPNINPSQLGWYETSKVAVASTETSVVSGTTYYAKNGTEYIIVVTGNLNPNALGWFENNLVVSERSAVTTGDTYYAKKADGSIVEVINPSDPNPSELGWFIRDNDTGVKTESSDTTRQTGTTYYVLMGKETYVEVTSDTTIKPKDLGWFQANKVVSNDISVNGSKQYYYKDASGNYVEITDVTNINPYAMGLYVDGPKVATTDVALNYNKDYYLTSTSSSKISSFYNPSALGWYEDYKKKSTDTTKNASKNYYVRYLTNPNAATPVTTEGLELASITLPYPSGAAPKVNFYPCSREYAMDASHNYVVNDNENNMFLADNTFEELYGHQFIIAWTLNYHNYLSDKWHSSYPFDASAQTQYLGGTVENTFFSSLATNRQSNKITEYVTGLSAGSLPAGNNTVFGKNAYMAIPHNYIALDRPKKVPSSYTLLWDSGKESEGTSEFKFVTNRSLVSDPYNAVYGYRSSDTTNIHPYTTAYLVGKNGSNDRLVELKDIQINNKKADFVNNAKAVNYIVNETKRNTDNYAIGDVKINSDQLTAAGIPLSSAAANAGEGDAPVVIPVQLYSNKYVKEKQPLHSGITNTYIKGSSDMGSDSNWTFRSTTSNSDKYSSLFTGIFNADPTTASIPNSELFVRARMAAGEINGYYVELKAPKAAVENAAGVRLRFDVYNYVDVDTSSGGSPKANGWYEVVKNKIATEDTAYNSSKAYYYRNTTAGINYYSTNDTAGINPHNFQWYELGGTVGSYAVSTDTSVDTTKTYFYKNGTSYEEIDLDHMDPKAMGWYEDKYSEETLSADTTINPAKTYRKQTDVKYSTYVDKYLVNDVDTKDSYGVIGTEVKMNEVKSDGYVYLYFAIDVSDVSSDTRFGIGSDGKLFNGKDGVHITADFLYESDIAGYSHIKFTEGSDDASWRNALSNRANGIINNYDLGSFAIRTYKQNGVNSYYYKTADKQYTALKTKTQKDFSTNVYTVQPHETGGEVTLNKFGSFFEVGGVSNASNGSAQLKIKATRDGLNDLNTIDITAQSGVGDIVVPTLLTTGNVSAAIKVHTWDAKNFVYDPLPAVGGKDYGLIKFPRSNIYIDFDLNAADGNCGAVVDRQTADLRYILNNTDENSSGKIYATVTKKPLNDCKGMTQEQIDEIFFDSYYFVNEGGAVQTSTIVTDYNGSTEVVPQINQKALFKTYKDTDPALDNVDYYFNHIATDFPGSNYNRMFIPVNYTSSELLLKGLPYSASITSKSEFHVYFWVWSLINEDPDGSEYGWVNIGYTNNKDFKPIKVTTGVVPNPVINTFELNHDSYENRSLKIDLEGTADDLYYVVDLYDKSTGTPVFKSHLFTRTGSNYVYKSIYDPASSDYINPLAPDKPADYVPMADPYTGNPNANLFVFDLDDYVGGDGAQAVKQGNTLEVDATTGNIKIVDPTSASTFFQYGKVGTDPNLTDRYEVKLRAYFNGTGPVALADPNTYDWDTDPDSVYKVYKFKAATAGGVERWADHYDTTSAGVHAKTFSVDNDFDKVEIGVSNKSFMIKDNDPYIEFIVEPITYGSQSIAYEKYIPLIVHYTPDPADTDDSDGTDTLATDITARVLSGDLGQSVPAITVGANGELEFPTLEATRIKFDANYAGDDGGIFHQDDIITLYLFSYQDDITVGNPVKVEKTETEIKDQLKALFDDYLAGLTASNNLPAMSTTYDVCTGDEVAGFRLVAALNAKILPKSVKIGNANSVIEGIVTDEYKEKFLDYHKKYDANEIAKANLQTNLTSVELDKIELERRRNEYLEATSEDAQNAYVDFQYRSFVERVNTLTSSHYNPDEREEVIVNMIIQDFFKDPNITPYINRFNAAALKYGYYDVAATEAVLVTGDDPDNYTVVNYNVFKEIIDIPADAHTVRGTYDLLKDAQIAYGYEDVEHTIKVWVIDVADDPSIDPLDPSYTTHPEIVVPPDLANPVTEDADKRETVGTHDEMTEAEEKLKTTRKFDYDITINLIDCDGAVQLGDMEYTIGFYKEGVQVGDLTTSGGTTVPVELIPGTTRYEFNQVIPEPTQASGAPEEYDEIRITISLTEKSGGEISIVKSEGSTITVHDVEYETGDLSIDDLEITVDVTKLNTGSGVPESLADGHLAKCDFSFKHS